MTNNKQLVSVDRSVLEELRSFQAEGEPDVVVDLIDAYLPVVETKIEKIQLYILEDNLDMARREAQNLKTNSFIIGVDLLGSYCHEMESVTDSHKAKDILEKMKNEYFVVTRILKDIKAQSPG